MNKQQILYARVKEDVDIEEKKYIYTRYIRKK